MATFLQLCVDLARESGAIGAPPATVVGNLPTRQAQCVSWIRNAWLLIQNASPHWNFLRASFAAPLTIGVNSYAPAALGIASRFAEWVEETPRAPAMSIYDPVIGRNDEQWLREIDLDRWTREFDFGAQTNQRPTYWSVGYDGSLKLGTAPDKAYWVRGGYRKAPQVLAADNDVPEMPDRFHPAIWQRAIMLMGASDVAPDVYQFANNEFTRLYSDMTRDLLPKIGVRAEGSMDRR